MLVSMLMFVFMPTLLLLTALLVERCIVDKRNCISRGSMSMDLPEPHSILEHA